MTIKLNPISEVMALLEEAFAQSPCHVEQVPIEESLGRILAEDILSQETIPAFAKSTVDGYAVQFAKAPCTLTLLGHVEMGEGTTLRLAKDNCLYVPTGGMIPEGTDTLVMIENTEKMSNGKIFFQKIPQERENIIEVGADMQVGSKVLEKGFVMDAHGIGAMAAMGRYEIPVFSKPKLTIFSTGDELTVSPDPLKLGQIREINTFTLKVLAQSLGFDVIQSGVLKDDYTAIKTALENAYDLSDMVVISGGSSVGEKDYTLALLNETCESGVLLNGMAIKPGKPTIIARHIGKPIIGLPGHPVSSIVVFNLLAKRILKTWGWQIKEPNEVSALLEKNIYGASGKDTYQMVWVEKKRGEWTATPTTGKSGMITLLTRSNAYVIIPKERGHFEQGRLVKAYWF